MYRLLLIDDEVSVLETRKAFLVEKGNVVNTAQMASQAILYAAQSTYDCILLDVMLFETTGFRLCDELKKINTAPIIFLSSLTDVQSQIKGFEQGGADYIAKDCDLELFWTKVKARIEIDKKSEKDTKIAYPLFVVDLKNRTVFLDSKELILTNIEFDILALIAAKPEYIWSVNEIYNSVWGYDALDSGQTIQAHMSRLRRKMEKAFSRHYFIETVWGKGYQFILMNGAESSSSF